MKYKKWDKRFVFLTIKIIYFRWSFINKIISGLLIVKLVFFFLGKTLFPIQF